MHPNVLPGSPVCLGHVPGPPALPQSWAMLLGLQCSLSLWRCWAPLHLQWQKKNAGSWHRHCLQLGCAGSGEPISSLFPGSHWHYATSPCIFILFRMGRHSWLASAPRPPHTQGLTCSPGAPHCRHPCSWAHLGAILPGCLESSWGSCWASSPALQ